MMDSILFMTKRVFQRPLRSLLTALQLALGIWLVTVIFSIYFHGGSQLAGSTHAFDSVYAKLDLAMVERQIDRTYYRPVATLETEDLQVLQGESENIETAFFHRPSFSAFLSYNGRGYRVQTVAETSANFADAVNLDIIEGHYFTELDDDQSSNVVLVSETIRDYLFPGEPAVGQIVELLKSTGVRGKSVEQQFEVIGVYRHLPPLESSFLGDSFLITPRTNYGLFDGDGEYAVFIKALPGRLQGAIQDAETILSFHQSDGAIFRVTTLQEQMQWKMERLKTLSIFLGVFGFIALVVSAIGVFSILMVSVFERTREIGLRRALGATKSSVIKQILGESLLYTVLGAVIGIPVASFSAKTLGMPFITELLFGGQAGAWSFSWLAALYAFVLACGATLLLSLYPALKGAKTPPTEALREL